MILVQDGKATHVLLLEDFQRFHYLVCSLGRDQTSGHVVGDFSVNPSITQGADEILGGDDAHNLTVKRDRSTGNTIFLDQIQRFEHAQIR